jgi:hypothetical protein
MLMISGRKGRNGSGIKLSIRFLLLVHGLFEAKTLLTCQAGPDR